MTPGSFSGVKDSVEPNSYRVLMDESWHEDFQDKCLVLECSDLTYNKTPYYRVFTKNDTFIK